MNAGFSSLKKLKAAVLPAPLRTRLDWDDALINLGLGAAEMMEGYCNRVFGYAADKQPTMSADRIVFSVNRYPVSAWGAVEIQAAPGEAFTVITDLVTRFESAAGIFYFRTPPGGEYATLRVTYSGGFWWDDTEEASGIMPEGATALPYAIFSAWSLQVQAMAQAQDLFGTVAAMAKTMEGGKIVLPQLELVPVVKQMLNPFRRFAA